MVLARKKVTAGQLAPVGSHRAVASQPAKAVAPVLPPRPSIAANPLDSETTLTTLAVELARPDDLAANVARNLILARSALDVTQDRLATISKVSRATIAQIESGNSDARLGTLADIAAALKISPALLLLRPAEITALFHFVRQSAVERILAKLSPQQITRMNELRQTGFQKDLFRVAHAGIAAAQTAGFKTPGAVVGAGIGSTILPGLGTAVGAVLGGALDGGARHQADLEEGAGI